MEHPELEDNNDSTIKNEDSEYRFSNESSNTTLKQDKKLIFSTKEIKKGETKSGQFGKGEFGVFAYKIRYYFGKDKNKKILDIVNEISFCVLLINEI